MNPLTNSSSEPILPTLQTFHTTTTTTTTATEPCPPEKRQLQEHEQRPVSPASLQEPQHRHYLLQVKQQQQLQLQQQLSTTSLSLLPQHLTVPPRTPSPNPSVGSSRRSSNNNINTRPSSLRLGITASALLSSPGARAVRDNVFQDIVGGWSMLTTSSKALVLYYIISTVLEIIVVVTICVLEREKARSCVFLIVFLGLYLVRSVVLLALLLRRFLVLRPNDLPQGFGEACGTHYKTLLNWVSVLLAMASIAILTTQAKCAHEAPALFYLVLVFSLVGYVCLAMLLFVWIVVMFCLDGLVAVLEMFGVGPTVMQWEGATPEMIEDLPIVKYKGRPEQHQEQHQNQQQQSSLSLSHQPVDNKKTLNKTSEKDRVAVKDATHPSIVISEAQMDQDHYNNNIIAEGIEQGSTTITANIEECLEKKEKANGCHTNQGSPDSRAVFVLDMDSQSQRKEVLDQYQQQTHEHIILEDLDHTHGHGHEQQQVTSTKTSRDNDHDDDDDEHPGAAPDQTEMSCVICLCEYEPEELLRQMPCQHLFHKECVDEWLKLKRTCPLCKFDITKVNRVRNWRRQHFRRRSSQQGNNMVAR